MVTSELFANGLNPCVLSYTVSTKMMIIQESVVLSRFLFGLALCDLNRSHHQMIFDFWPCKL